MNSQSGLGLVRRRWRLMGSILVLCLLIGAAVSVATPKRYEASAQLFVSTPLSPSGNLETSQQFVEARVQSYVSLVNAPDLTSYVVSNLHLSMSAGALGREITADAPINKVLLNIHVTDASAKRAALLANAVASRFVTETEDLENSLGKATSPVTLTVTKDASTPHTAVQPKTKVNIAIALLLGLLLAYAGGVLRARSDDTLRTVEELESFAGTPVLGALPRRSRGRSKQAVSPGQRHRAAGSGPAGRGRGRPSRDLTQRGFDLIAAGLPFLNPEQPVKVILMTAVQAGGGATFVATGVADSLIDSGGSVVLVDANLRFPALAGRFGLPPEPGLTAAITGSAEAPALGRHITDRLTVVPSGVLPPNPRRVVSSPRMGTALATLSAAAQRTVVDGAPVLPHGDGAAMGDAVDATVLVVRAGKTSRKDLAAALAAFEEAGVRPAATVLTEASPGVVKGLLAKRGLSADLRMAPNNRVGAEPLGIQPVFEPMRAAGADSAAPGEAAPAEVPLAELVPADPRASRTRPTKRSPS